MLQLKQSRALKAPPVVEYFVDTHATPLYAFEQIIIKFFNEQAIFIIDNDTITKFIDFCITNNIAVRSEKPTKSVRSCLNVVLKRALGAYKSAQAFARVDKSAKIKDGRDGKAEEKPTYVGFIQKAIPDLQQYLEDKENKLTDHEWLKHYVLMVLGSSRAVDLNQLSRNVLRHMGRDKIMPSHRTHVASVINIAAIVEYEAKLRDTETFRPQEIRGRVAIDRPAIKMLLKNDKHLRDLMQLFLNVNYGNLVYLPIPVPMLHDSVYSNPANSVGRVIDYDMNYANFLNAIRLFRKLANAKALNSNTINIVCQSLNLIAKMYSDAENGGLFQHFSIPYLESMFSAGGSMKLFNANVDTFDSNTQKSILHYAVDYTMYLHGRKGFSYAGILYSMDDDDCMKIDAVLSSVFCTGELVGFKSVIEWYLNRGYSTGIAQFNKAVLKSVLT